MTSCGKFHLNKTCFSDEDSEKKMAELAEKAKKDAEVKAQEDIAKKKKEEEDEKAKEQQKAQDKSKPISSTPVPGTPWFVFCTITEYSTTHSIRCSVGYILHCTCSDRLTLYEFFQSIIQYNFHTYCISIKIEHTKP